MRPGVVLAAFVVASCACANAGPARSRDARTRGADELSALWSFYKYTFLEHGRVAARDEGGITTSEGQSYALLRAVWSGDRATFDEVWRWTREHLQVRKGDRLLAWKWSGTVVDLNSAADADVDVALALVLASRRFSDSRYQRDALELLDDVWRLETVAAGGRRWPVAGNWAAAELYPTLHVGYLAPHAYQVFAAVDARHPWQDLVANAYDVLHFIYVEQGLALPPERIWVDTSQKLHGKGWRSAFVDEDLAAGLSAETLQIYLVQRRRWMLGCLQILFKDNPLWQGGLTVRQRLGYFASLYYFLFPVARVAFWATPAWFLLFHLHPLFADVSELLGYLLPAMVLLPLASTALLPGWPRLLWSVVHEYLVCFPLLRAMFDLALPKRLGFKVTPKGIVSGRRAFDFASSRLTLAASAVMVIAVVKGFAELAWFGIEKDAYFFNVSWALANLVAIAAALLVAWERPQRRAEERVALRHPATLDAAGVTSPVTLTDLSLGGAGAELPVAARWPEEAELALSLNGLALRVPVRLVRCETRRGVTRGGLAFGALAIEERRALVRALFGRADTWAHAHDARPRTNAGMALSLFAGLARCFVPWRERRRRSPRRRALARLDLVFEGGAARALVLDRGPGGMGLLVLSRRLPDLGELPLLGEAAGPRWMRVVHRRRVAPFVWRVGFEPAAPAAVTTVYLAA